MSRHLCTARMRYHANGSRKKLKNYVKYLQYREGRHTKAPAGQERWLDRGLGSSYQQIVDNCLALETGGKLDWYYLFSPNPKLMALLPDEVLRRQVLIDLTDTAIERFYTERGYKTPPYALVIHDKEARTGDRQQHTHVILPGAAETVMGWEEVQHFKDKGHLTRFSDLAEQIFEEQLDQVIGREWRLAVPEVEPFEPYESPEISLDDWFAR